MKRPKYDRPHNVKPYRNAPLEAARATFPASTDLNADLLKLVGSPDLCSKRWIWEQYDYTVRTNTIAGPGSDAAIVRVKETDQSIAMSLDGNGRYCYLDPREGAKLAVAECCRNLATTGALPVAATNNLNFGNPERPEIMAQLVEAIEGIAEACAFFETPITGGNVSLYNETLGEGIYPTPVLGIVGLMKTAVPAPVQFQQRRRGDRSAGRLRRNRCAVDFGSSEYAKVILKQLWGLPPQLDMDYEKRVHDAMREIVAAGLGGIRARSERWRPGGCAERILHRRRLARTSTLRWDRAARIRAVRRSAFAHSAHHSRTRSSCRKSRYDTMSNAPVIGVTMKERLQIGDGSTMLIDLPRSDLKHSFENSLPAFSIIAMPNDQS